MRLDCNFLYVVLNHERRYSSRRIELDLLRRSLDSRLSLYTDSAASTSSSIKGQLKILDCSDLVDDLSRYEVQTWFDCDDLVTSEWSRCALGVALTTLGGSSPAAFDLRPPTSWTWKLTYGRP